MRGHKQMQLTKSKRRTEAIQSNGLRLHLTDVSGPRLTNSPGFFRAANWAGINSPKWDWSMQHSEPWGDFVWAGNKPLLYRHHQSLLFSGGVYSPCMDRQHTRQKAISSEVIVINAKDSAELYSKYSGRVKAKHHHGILPDTPSLYRGWRKIYGWGTG